jgi:hypothetical protein
MVRTSRWGRNIKRRVFRRLRRLPRRRAASFSLGLAGLVMSGVMYATSAQSLPTIENPQHPPSFISVATEPGVRVAVYHDPPFGNEFGETGEGVVVFASWPKAWKRMPQLYAAIYAQQTIRANTVVPVFEKCVRSEYSSNCLSTSDGRAISIAAGPGATSDSFSKGLLDHGYKSKLLQLFLQPKSDLWATALGSFDLRTGGVRKFLGASDDQMVGGIRLPVNPVPGRSSAGSQQRLYTAIVDLGPRLANKSACAVVDCTVQALSLADGLNRVDVLLQPADPPSDAVILAAGREQPWNNAIENTGIQIGGDSDTSWLPPSLLASSLPNQVRVGVDKAWLQLKGDGGWETIEETGPGLSPVDAELPRAWVPTQYINSDDDATAVPPTLLQFSRSLQETEQRKIYWSAILAGVGGSLMVQAFPLDGTRKRKRKNLTAHSDRHKGPI